MRSFFGRLGVALVLFALGCSIEHPTERDAGACGISGTACCRFDAGIRLDASGLMSNGCATGLSCVSNVCRACPSGQQLCNGACVDVRDRNNCGACGNACVPGFDCITAGDGGAPSCERVCPPGQNRCGGGAQGICTDLNVDSQNCGTCGTNCTAMLPPNVTVAACMMGRCAVGTCATNFANCDMNQANGCEVNTQSDAMNCGGCGRACVVPPNAVAVCRAGSCDFTCMAGFSDCDRNPTNGCETNLNTDPQNCRMCNNRCPTQTGQTATCRAGVCGTTTTLMCPAGSGDCNLMSGDGCETNLNNTLAHCGACGEACSRANAMTQCLAGSCLLTSCNAPFQNCDGITTNGCETNLSNSETHCGRCGGFCNFPNAAATCLAGSCALASCNAGFANCNAMAVDGCEIDTRNNPVHCGRCGVQCGLGQQCINSTCTLVCPPGTDVCNGRCVDRNTDNANCGVCSRACGPGQVCSNGVCNTSCGAGQTNCSNSCRDLSSDVNHCGMCDRACGAGQRCNAGTCVLSCPTGQTACGSNCRDLTNDAANCGACGTTCSRANSTPSCVNSACALGACTGTFANCDGNATNGCETNTNTSLTNCGACGTACSFANATAVCTNGRCGLGTCNSGFGNCDGIAENGCETNLNTSVNHCRTCGTICTTMTAGLVPVCTAGTCGTALGMCPGGTADCNAMAGDGCETNISTSLASCGACGQACSRANAAQTCTSGVCVLGACNSGFGNCDGDAVNGCETNTTTSITHCGGCGRPCFFANASATCASGTCALGTCATGFANCDSNASNGCEAGLQSDRSNCGACGRQCNSGEVCSAGVCTLMCQSGQTNCSGSCVSTATDRANCGTCGNACAAGRICQGGSCVLSCPTGQTACGSVCVNTQTDAANCGACGTTCTGGRICNAGACACPSGTFLCGSTCIDTRSDPLNCGPLQMSSCGNACMMNQVCSNGACVTTCSGGLTNCGGACVSTSTSLSHCGSCGNVCSLANATNTCSSGSCAVSSCSTGFANCNSMSADGCEVNITSSATNCNGCNNNCNTLPGVMSASCVASSCANLMCMTGRGDCNSNTGDGCESTLATDAVNCGACGNNCTSLPQVATATCGAGTCSVSTCNTNFGNCDSMSSNGCETDLRSTTAHCGACGATCGSSNTLNSDCLSGRCNCSSGFLDCDTNRANGCETNRLTNPMNCGQCGTVCSGGTPACVFGSCQPSGCGADGEACCSGTVCGSGLACVSGNCTNTCGASGQPCCAGNNCNGGLTCTAGTCMP